STRVGFHEYTFNESGQANIILDLNHRDKLLEGEVRILDNKTIEVFRRSEAWAINQYVYANIQFDSSIEVSTFEANQKQEQEVYSASVSALAISKNVKKRDKIKVKVALSLSGYEVAKLISSEICH